MDRYTPQKYLELVTAAYKDPPDRSTVLAETAGALAIYKPLLPELECAHFFHSGARDRGRSDAQMYTLRLKDHLVFVMRGTEGPLDVKADITFWKSPFQDVQFAPSVDPQKYGNTKVHTGFLHQFNTVKFSIMSTLFGWIWKSHRKAEYAIPPVVYVAGHSLGGAVATLAAAAVKAHFGDEIKVYCVTFGSPRVGNSDFVRFFDDHVDGCARYVNGVDIMTRIPTLGYNHVKGEILIGEGEHTCWTRRTGRVEDHYCKSYEESLKVAARPKDFVVFVNSIGNK